MPSDRRTRHHPVVAATRCRARVGTVATGGYSLMEVLFAMAIMGVGLIAVASLFPVAFLQQKRAQDDIQGGMVGRNVLAQLASVDKATVFPVHTAPDDPNDFFPVDITNPVVVDALPAYSDTASDPAGVISSGFAQAGSATTVTLRATAPNQTGFYNGMQITITGGMGANSTPHVITGYNGATKVVTAAGSWTPAPDATSLYRIQSVPGQAPAMRYDYRILYRRPSATSAIEVAVFVFRPSNLQYIGYYTPGPGADASVDGVIPIANMDIPVGATQLEAVDDIAARKLAHRRNQYLFGWTAGSLDTPQVMRVIGGEARPRPEKADSLASGTLVRGEIVAGPNTHVTKVAYSHDPSVAIAMGVIR